MIDGKIEIEIRKMNAMAAAMYRMGYIMGVSGAIRVIKTMSFLSDKAAEKLEHLLLGMAFSQRNLNAFAHLYSINLKEVPEAKLHINLGVYPLKIGDIAKTIGTHHAMRAVDSIYGMNESRLISKDFYTHCKPTKAEHPDTLLLIRSLIEYESEQGMTFVEEFWPANLHTAKIYDLSDAIHESNFEFSDSFAVDFTFDTKFFETRIISTLDETPNPDIPHFERILRLSKRKIPYYLPSDAIERERVTELRAKNPGEGFDFIDLLEDVCLRYGATFDCVAQPTAKYMEGKSPSAIAGFRKIAQESWSVTRHF